MVAPGFPDSLLDFSPMLDLVPLNCRNPLVLKEVSLDLAVREPLVSVVVLSWKRVCSVSSIGSIQLYRSDEEVSVVIVYWEDLGLQHLFRYYSLWR